MKFKKLLAFILSLCIIFGMAAIGVSAVDPVSSDSDAVILKLNSDEVLEIYSNRYRVYSGSKVRWGDFTGDYILTGEVNRINFYTSCDVTLHNLSILTSDSFVAFWGSYGITVNLTANGINSIVSSNKYAIGDVINVNLTVENNSSITLKGGSGYKYSSSTLAMADGSALPAVSADGSLTVSKGTPTAHTVSITALTGGKHKVSCSVGDLEYTVNCSSFNYTAVNDDVCKRVCNDCEDIQNVVHYYLATGTYETNSHEAMCLNCRHEATRPHTYNKGYYMTIDKNNCAKVCDECYHADEVNGLVPHSFTKLVSDNEGWHGYVCKHCENVDGETWVRCTFDDGIKIPATREYGPSVRNTCNICKYKKIVPIESESIIFNVYDEENDSWEGNAIVVYVNGVPERVITNKGDRKPDTYTETYWMEFDPEASYVFKWLDGADTFECKAKICLPTGEDGEPGCVFEEDDFTSYDNLETIFTYNMADYKAVDAALAKIPDLLEYYTANSVNDLVTAVKGVKRMLPKSKQSEVDAMATAVENAVNKLVELETPVANGVINLTDGKLIEINFDSFGYSINYNSASVSYDFDYQGKYVFLETAEKDYGNEKYVSGGIAVYDGTVEIEVVNTFIDFFDGALRIWNDADVSLKPFGANAFFSDKAAGILVTPYAKLTILEGDGSILAVGGQECAGIGGNESGDNGEVVIEGSTVFALSQGDGAGIGGGHGGGAGKITINGGVIHAQCLYDDGAGIGCGCNGNGGYIVINGGDIVALNTYKEGDGAGIGGADVGSINSITINGGKIIAGSIYGAAIGGGFDSNYCGKITINGGTLTQSIYHQPSHCFIGHSYGDEYYAESKNSSVQINGGIINENTDDGIVPAPTNKDGKPVEKLTVTIPAELLGEDITIELADGTKINVNSDEEEIAFYAPEDAEVSEIYLTSEGGNNDDDVFWLVRIFRAIIAWFESVFQSIGDFFSGIFTR